MPFIRFVDRITATSVSAARGKQALSPRVLFGFWTAGSKNQDTSRIVTDGNVCALHTTSVGRNDRGTGDRVEVETDERGHESSIASVFSEKNGAGCRSVEAHDGFHEKEKQKKWED